MRKKIAFIRIWSAHAFSKATTRILENYFTDFDLDVIEVPRLLRSYPLVLLINFLHVMRFYGLDIIRRKKRLRDYFFATPYMFKRVREILQKRLLPHKQDYIFTFQLFSLYDASLPGIPHFIYTDHCALANLEYPGFDRRQLYCQPFIELEKQVYQNATCTFTLSNHVTRAIIQHYGVSPEQVTCVYTGSNAPVEAVELNNNRYQNKNILFVGFDWERKGGPQLVEAFKTLLRVHPDAHLTIIGHSPSLNLPNYTAIPYVPTNDLPEYYRKASVFCMPTRLEPFGGVFVEAMSHSLPIVSTNIGALPDFVTNGENGYLVAPDDINGLTSALVKLVSNPELCRNFGQASYQRVRDRYNWESVINRMKDRIQQSLN